jgi:hypothetical protein
MFYEAYELFENKRYLECIDMFSKFIEHYDDKRKKFWSLIFISRSNEIMSGFGVYENLMSALDIFPERAEILYELGKFHYKIGDLEKARGFLESAKDSPFREACVRFESDKYLEAPLELLSDIYALTHKYNFQEEATHTLLVDGNKSFYNTKKIEYQHRWSRHYNNAALEFLRAKEMKVGDKLVIELPEGYDGLGDNFVFSHIPRIAKESGKFKEVYLSSGAKYKGESYRELVWEKNPYLDGIVDEPGTYSEIDMRRVLTHWQNILPSLNLLDSIMLLHGLDNGKRGHRPECYYRPNMIDGLKEKVILDPGTKSIKIDSTTGDDLINDINKSGVSVDMIIDQGPNSPLVFSPSYEKLSPSSIYEWADIIWSAKSYLCFNSGGYWLSSALGINPIHLGLKTLNIPAWCPYDYTTIDIRLKAHIDA